MGKMNFEKDSIKSFTNEESIVITFIMHGSLVIEYRGETIYVDPVMEYCDYNNMPKADHILVTHDHFDHYDKDAINAIIKGDTILIGSPSVIEDYGRGISQKNGDKHTHNERIAVEAVPAYNVSEGALDFHPKGINNGYVLDLEGTRIYISGDTELIPEMEDLKDRIHIAFLSVNQPYTMTVDQAVEAAGIINPKIFYPYHYGQTEIDTPIDKLLEGLSVTGIDVRVRKLM